MAHRLVAAPIIAVLLVVMPALPVAGQPSATDEEFDRRILAELRAQNADAAAFFEKGNAARDRDDWAGARHLYREVTARVPGFDHAWRRRCGVERILGLTTEAIASCRTALKTDPSAANLASLALALISEGAPTTGQDEAAGLTDRAWRLEPSNAFVQAVRCDVALGRADFSTVNACSKALVELDSSSPVGYTFRVFALAGTGEFDAARGELEKARAKGMPEDRYRELSEYLNEAEPLTARYGALVAWVVGAWIASAMLLVLLGWVLSRATLRAAARPPREATGRAVGAGAKLRGVYKGVLWLACAYYYLSIPLVLLAVLAVGAGIIYLFVLIGRIPVKLVLGIALLVLATVWVILKNVFVRVREEDPGALIDPTQHPRLEAVLKEVAGRVGIDAPDRVFLTPGTDLAVFERGGMLKQLRDRKERCLILGVAVLDGMPVGSFKAILAHEYGHLSNRDTAGGGFALSVRRSLLTMANALARKGAAAWYNPAWLFLNGFYRIFLRISHGASRLQEVLADRWAALCYGAASFERGLRHVIERSVRFDAHVDATLKEVVEGQKALVNLYGYPLASPVDPATVDAAVASALNAAPTAYDSHPSPKERFAYVNAIGGPERKEDCGTAWELFDGREALEREMTDVIRSNVADAIGVMIPKELDAAEDAPPGGPAASA